jgi:type IV pilus assembly protein PilX
MKKTAHCKTAYYKYLNHNFSYQQQKGFILISGMLLLIIMTLIILYSMGNAIVQEKNSGSLTDRKIAFQNAESALRFGENYVYNNNLAPHLFNSSCNNGLCLSSTPPVWQNIDWKNDTSHTISLPNNTIANVSKQPKFIVELLGAVPAPAGESLKSETGQGTAYRITTYATGSRESSVVMLQSVFSKR